MNPSRAGAARVRRGAAACAALLLLPVLGACSSGDSSGQSEASPKACGLVDRSVMSAVADGRPWRNAGVLYADGSFRDVCTVLVRSDPFLVATMTEFDRDAQVGPARTRTEQEIAQKRAACRDVVENPVDGIGLVCDRADEVSFVGWNDHRTVRLSLERSAVPGVTVQDMVKVVRSLNDNADALAAKS